MLRIEDRAPSSATPVRAIALRYDQRQRYRLRATLPDGEELVLVLPERGAFLQPGDHLLATDGRVVSVEAAEEDLVEVAASPARALARAAYHLGNRHVAVQILDGAVRFVADHVLERMIDGLGLPTRRVRGVFEPERGAYAAGGPTHARERAHDEDHDHEPHDDGHAHGEGAHGRLAPVPSPRIHDFVRK